MLSSAKVDCKPEEVDYDGERLLVLNRHLEKLIEEGTILSGSYCLWRRGKVFADAAIGNLACEWQGRTTFEPDTFFELQSVTKAFTAVAILKLAEDGILYLGQPVCQWISEFLEGDFRDITIIHLLTHTAGLQALPGTWSEDKGPFWWTHMDEDNPKGTWLTALIKAGLYAKPGQQWIYAAMGYPVLGEIIKRASGMDAEEYITESIFKPCQMSDTHWRRDVTTEKVKRYNISKPYDVRMVHSYQEKGLSEFAKPTYLWWEGIPDTAGGIMSTARELVQFGEMLLRGGNYRGNRVIGKTALSYLWENMVPEDMKDYCWDHTGYPVVYGAGMPIVKRNKELLQMVSDNVIYHEGSGCCVFMVDKEEDFVAVFQVSFPDEDKWNHQAVKGTASIIWSGIR